MRIFRPSDAPAWLAQVLASIERLFRDIMPAPFRLWRSASADLPSAADYGGALAWDETALLPTWSDGSGWVSPSLSTHAHAASATSFAPAGGIAAANVQAAIVELDMEKAAASHAHAIAQVTGLQAALDAKAPKAGPAFTGSASFEAASFSGNVTLGDASTDSMTTHGTLTIRSPRSTSAPSIKLRQSDGTAGQMRGNYLSFRDNADTEHGFFGFGSLGADTFFVYNFLGKLSLSSAPGTPVEIVAADVIGEMRCDSLRIDQAATAGTFPATHHLSISLNGTTYRIPCAI